MQWIKILKSPVMPWCVLFLCAIFNQRLFTTNRFFANPLEYILLSFGNIAIYLFVINSIIPFLILITPKFFKLSALKKHRRTLGIMCYVLTLLHILTYVIDTPFDMLLSNFAKTFIIFGTLAFIFLSVLAITSNDWSIKKLGGTKWKRLHYAVYLLVPLLIAHITVENKDDPAVALQIFIPLLFSYLARIIYFLISRTNILKSSRSSN